MQHMLLKWNTALTIQVTHQGQVKRSGFSSVARAHQLVHLTQGGRCVKIKFVDLPGPHCCFLSARLKAAVDPVLAPVGAAVEQDVSLVFEPNDMDRYIKNASALDKANMQNNQVPLKTK